MAHQWEMPMTIDHYGMGMVGGSYSNYSNISAAQMNSASNVNPAYYYGVPSNNDSVRVDDMLDLSNAQELFPTASASALADNNHLIAGQGDQSQTASARNSVSSYDSFANEFYVPSEEAAELEWLSKFVDDSYSDMPSAMAANMGNFMNASNEGNQLGADNSSGSAGRGARSKRNRAASAVAAAWHSLIPPPQSSPSSSSSSSDFPSKPSKGGSANRGKKTGIGSVTGSPEVGLEGGVRRCTHCASEKTPQWRTGPLGPKTLCNACGVRYKSGRLMPEYRPAASPTFVLTQHSNSHRKVMELRRQKELMMLRHRDNPSAAAAAAANAAVGRPELMYHDYGVC
ncbi:GATA transcription factor [Rhynchospora pubera]|uniref:GATA transcription factor n=1 Tax=Rhynchospora pubera TaxID=906938 RepID=A0AAV8GI08_9POAL|nr:GATA transcription factor [Rhynchospora pubera]